MLGSVDRGLETKHPALGQIVQCRGCGVVTKGKPAIPVEWRQPEAWSCRLLEKIQLTTGGCPGPYDLSNVVSVSNSATGTWLLSVRHFCHFEALPDWAAQSSAAEAILSPPAGFEQLRGVPFRQIHCPLTSVGVERIS